MTRNRFTLLSPAKVNLLLEAGPGRGDGYHDITTVYQAVSLYDRLSFAPAGELSLRVAPHMPVPPGENLAYKAAALLRERMGVREGASLHLKKSIPMGAGLGGGSSDAACVLLGLCRLWGLPPGRGVLQELAEGLGSDVPFFLDGGTALGQGRGEKITPLAIKGGRPLHMVILFPGFSVSTQSVYKDWDSSGLSSRGQGAGAMVAALQDGDAREVARQMHNDFEPLLFRLHPKIQSARDALVKAGARNAMVSGSGSSVFGIFAGREGAVRAADDLRNEGTAFAVESTGGVADGGRDSIS
jgi:4-diphosphocytidyl-2-C-methyl-D-erythritol kinase